MRVHSQGFDTAIQALRLPWSQLPYMVIEVKEQREWAVWGSTHTHTHTGRMWRVSLLRCREHDPKASNTTPTIPDYPKALQRIQASSYQPPAHSLSSRKQSGPSENCCWSTTRTISAAKQSSSDMNVHLHTRTDQIRCCVRGQLIVLSSLLISQRPSVSASCGAHGDLHSRLTPKRSNGLSHPCYSKNPRVKCR